MSTILKTRKSRLILLSIIIISIVAIIAAVRINKVIDTSKLTPKEFEEKHR